MSPLFRLSLLSVVLIFLAGCASSQMKTRKEQRDRVAQTSKLYCEFVNGDVYPDIDVALNLEMAKRCDSNKSSTITNYRSPSEAVGIVYCCSMKEKEEPKKPITESKSTDGQAPDVKTIDLSPEPKKVEKK